MIEYITKYVTETLAVAAVSYMLLKNQKDALLIGIIAGLTFFVLDYFVPSISDYARAGVGMGFGLMMVGGNEEKEFNEYKMIPTCPDPNNSGKALLAGYNENVTPKTGVDSLSTWPFESSQTIQYGSCDEARGGALPQLRRRPNIGCLRARRNVRRFCPKFRPNRLSRLRRSIRPTRPRPRIRPTQLSQLRLKPRPQNRQ